MGELQVQISPEAISLIKTFLQKPAKQEVGGILLGTVQTTGKGFTVDVSGAIGANPQESFIKEFHYDHAIWRELYSLKAEKYPDLDILGWFCSSRASGLIPSPNDIAIQKAFFNDKHQIFLMANPDDFSYCIFQWEKNYLMPIDQIEDEAEEFTAEKEQIFAAPSSFPELAKEVEILMEQSSRVNSQVSSTLESKYYETANESQQIQESTPVGIKIMVGLASILTLITLIVYPLIKTADTGVNPSSSPTPPPVKAQQNLAEQTPVTTPPESTAALTPPESTGSIESTAALTPPAAIDKTNTTAKTAGTNTYIVQPGDSLWKISDKLYGSGLKCYLLISANGLTTPSKLNTGLVLVVPPDN